MKYRYLLGLLSIVFMATAYAVSPDGTTVSGTGAIVDDSGNTWTMVGGVVYENAKAAGFSANVQKIEIAQGVVYQYNGSQWFGWTGSAWGAGSATAPTLAASVTLNIAGNIQVICPVTLANLFSAINSNMSCNVTVTAVSVTSQ